MGRGRRVSKLDLELNRRRKSRPGGKKGEEAGRETP